MPPVSLRNRAIEALFRNKWRGRLSADNLRTIADNHFWPVPGMALFGRSTRRSTTFRFTRLISTAWQAQDKDQGPEADTRGQLIGSLFECSWAYPVHENAHALLRLCGGHSYGLDGSIRVSEWLPGRHYVRPKPLFGRSLPENFCLDRVWLIHMRRGVVNVARPTKVLSYLPRRLLIAFTQLSSSSMSAFSSVGFGTGAGTAGD